MPRTRAGRASRTGRTRVVAIDPAEGELDLERLQAFEGCALDLVVTGRRAHDRLEAATDERDRLSTECFAARRRECRASGTRPPSRVGVDRPRIGRDLVLQPDELGRDAGEQPVVPAVDGLVRLPAATGGSGRPEERRAVGVTLAGWQRLDVGEVRVRGRRGHLADADRCRHAEAPLRGPLARAQVGVRHVKWRLDELDIGQVEACHAVGDPSLDDLRLADGHRRTRGVSPTEVVREADRPLVAVDHGDQRQGNDQPDARHEEGPPTGHCTAPDPTPLACPRRADRSPGPLSAGHSPRYARISARRVTIRWAAEFSGSMASARCAVS